MTSSKLALLAWPAQYDPNGVVNNPYDQTAVAKSTNSALAYLAPLTGHEFEGASLYVDGYALPPRSLRQRMFQRRCLDIPPARF